MKADGISKCDAGAEITEELKKKNKKLLEEIRSQKQEICSHKQEIRSHKQEIRSQKQEIRSQKKEIRSMKDTVKTFSIVRCKAQLRCYIVQQWISLSYLTSKPNSYGWDYNLDVNFVPLEEFNDVLDYNFSAAQKFWREKRNVWNRQSSLFKVFRSTPSLEFMERDMYGYILTLTSQVFGADIFVRGCESSNHNVSLNEDSGISLKRKFSNIQSKASSENEYSHADFIVTNSKLQTLTTEFGIRNLKSDNHSDDARAAIRNGMRQEAAELQMVLPLSSPPTNGIPKGNVGTVIEVKKYLGTCSEINSELRNAICQVIRRCFQRRMFRSDDHEISHLTTRSTSSCDENEEMEKFYQDLLRKSSISCSEILGLLPFCGIVADKFGVAVVLIDLTYKAKEFLNENSDEFWLSFKPERLLLPKHRKLYHVYISHRVPWSSFAGFLVFWISLFGYSRSNALHHILPYFAFDQTGAQCWNPRTLYSLGKTVVWSCKWRNASCKADPINGHQVALKCDIQDTFNGLLSASLYREFQVLKSLNEKHCPKIVQCLDYGRLGKADIEGIALYPCGIPSNRLNCDVSQLVLDIGSALQGMSSIGYLHMDVKPSNIIFDIESRSYYLCDFGSAILINSLPNLESPLGYTEAFASPAIVQGLIPRAIDDWFSLFSSAWFLSYGQLPWIDSKGECLRPLSEEVTCKLHFVEKLCDPIVRPDWASQDTVQERLIQMNDYYHGRILMDKKAQLVFSFQQIKGAFSQEMPDSPDSF